MTQEDHTARIDRHVLVLAAWLPAGFVALALFHYGFGAGGPWWLAGGFGAILAGYAAHVIVNAVLGTRFTGREVALSLVLFLVASVAFVLATLTIDGFAGRYFLPMAAGMASLPLAVILYMVTRFGARGAFETFDIIRDNNPRRSSRLPHRGGRR